MTNEDIYHNINTKGDLKKPSDIGVIPKDSNMKWSLLDFEHRIKDNAEFKLIGIDETTEESRAEGFDDTILSFNIALEYGNEAYYTDFTVIPMTNFQLQSYGFVNMIDQESINLALEAPYILMSTMYFVENPTLDFLVQLKILHTLIPEAAIGVDSSSLRVFSPYWLTMTAESSIPPSPEYLYSVHSVYEEKGDKTEYWLHTHGLHRCGSIEFEMLVKSNPQEMYNLLKNAAHLALTNSFEENESFKAGYDGMGINLCWIRWEEALHQFSPDVLGGMGDRIEEDGTVNVHAEPSGILFAVEDGEKTSPEIYGSTLKDNPIFFITNSETRRMSALAKERFESFKTIFEDKKPQKKSFFQKFISKDKDAEWSFLVKLGLTVDNAEDPENDLEHLWFEVSNIDSENRITGKLHNQPYWIASLKEGDTKTFPAKEVLTDWVIYGPEVQYTPDTIYAYYHN